MLQPTHPTQHPSVDPTKAASDNPSTSPTNKPNMYPTIAPTMLLSTNPTTKPTNLPSIDPTGTPTNIPSIEPTDMPVFIDANVSWIWEFNVTTTAVDRRRGNRRLLVNTTWECLRLMASLYKFY